MLFDKKAEKYYYKKKIDISQIKWDEYVNIRVQCFDIVGYILLILLPMIVVYLISWIGQIKWDEFECSISHIIFAFLFLVLNVCCHELAHYFAMKVYGKKTYIGIKASGNGFLFFVNTTATYLLPYYKRVLVYAIGMTINIYIVFFLVLTEKLLNVQVIVPVLFVIIYIVINLIPIQGRSNDFLQVINLLRKRK